MPERNAGKKAGTEKEGSGGQALRNKDRENTVLVTSSEGPQEPHRGTNVTGHG